MIVEKDKSLKLRFNYGKGKGSMTFSNVNPDVSDNRLMDLAEGINVLQQDIFQELYKIEEAELVQE